MRDMLTPVARFVIQVYPASNGCSERKQSSHPNVSIANPTPVRSRLLNLRGALPSRKKTRSTEASRVSLKSPPTKKKAELRVHDCSVCSSFTASERRSELR